MGTFKWLHPWKEDIVTLGMSMMHIIRRVYVLKMVDLKDSLMGEHRSNAMGISGILYANGGVT